MDLSTYTLSYILGYVKNKTHIDPKASHSASIGFFIF